MIVCHRLTIGFAPLLVIVLAAACGPGTETETAEESGEATAVPIAGMYEVEGTTVETETGREREISGSVILAQDGESYTATFHLNTVFEGQDGVLPAEVIGKGAGSIDGRTLRGTAETQLVISSVPGIDPAFAFIPRTTTTRLVSTSLTSIADDGTVEITIANEGAEGEAYRSTRTTLRGARTTLPPVASAPPAADESQPSDQSGR